MTLSGPGESSSNTPVQNPWSTRRVHVQGSPKKLQKGKGKLVDMPSVSFGHSRNDRDSSGLDVSLDKELGNLIMHTLGVKKAMKA